MKKTAANATINVRGTEITVIRNEDFKTLEFEGIKNEAGRDIVYFSANKWVSSVNSVKWRVSARSTEGAKHTSPGQARASNASPRAGLGQGEKEAQALKGRHNSRTLCRFFRACVIFALQLKQLGLAE